MIQGVRKHFLVDTGAPVTLVQSSTSKVPFYRTTLKPQGVSGKEIHVLGTQVIEFTIGNRTYGHEFTVSDLTIPADGLLGNEFLLEQEDVFRKRVPSGTGGCVNCNYQDL